jgi:signal transduction histidine kinase
MSDWAGASATPIDGIEDAVAIARAAESFWRQWRDQAPMPSQLVIRFEERPVLVVWRTDAAGLRAVVAGPTRVEAMRSQMSALADADVALSERDGQPVAANLSGPLALRAATATGLPWNVSIGSAHPDRTLAEANSRRQLLLAGLVIVGLLIAGSSYLTFRGIRRELATARLQSDFVSAVSHEFRTPLTSIRQLSHMLHEGRVGGDDRPAQYYGVLVRESERLHRLVERLLSFGRAEAERFRFEFLDARDLSRGVVSEFQQHTASWQFAITVSNADCPLRADREMLSLALWNLLDNAVKYSPGRETIWIDVAAGPANVSIAVRDEGGGIATGDRRRIFQKFVRGNQEQASGVAGSGLGLALVDRVVRGHGGVVRLESEIGRGSTFTMVLPIERAAGRPSESGSTVSARHQESATQAPPERREKTA